MHSTISSTSLFGALLYISGSQAIPTRPLAPRDANPLASLSNIQTWNETLDSWDSIHTYNTPSDLDVPFCAVSTHSVYGSWLITIPNDSKYDKTCGGGFLDNFRGRCGDITGWACDFVGAQKTTAALTFNSDSLCSASSGFDAIQAAGQNDFPGLQCLSSTPDTDPETHPDGAESPDSDGDDVGEKPGAAPVAPEPVEPVEPEIE